MCILFQAINVVCWSPCGKYLASGAVDGTVVLWSITGNRNAYKRCTNESRMGITSLEHSWAMKIAGYVEQLTHRSSEYLISYLSRCPTK